MRALLESTKKLALALALVAGLAGCGSDPEPVAAPPSVNPAVNAGVPAAPEAIGTRFMVASANPAASEAALAILKQGGSAVDAAIAAQMVLSLVEPQSSGIGGGAFLLHWDGVTHKLTALDGRETAPRSARADQFLDGDGKPLAFMDAALSGRSVGVPGVMRLLELAHRREGRLPWAALMQPAVDLALNGFVVSPQLADAIAAEPDLKRDADARALYFDAAGNPWQAGTTLTNRAYAETLRALQERGADAFYAGPIAQAIMAEVNADLTEGGTPLMVASDLIDYRARERAAVCGPYRGYSVCSAGPPTSGGIAMLQILGILQHFQMPALPPDGPQALHLIAESSRLAFADRDRYVADSDFARVPIKSLLDPTYLKARAGQIRADRSIGEAFPGKFSDPMIVAQASQRQFEPASTSHFVIVDSAGDIVSMTSSVEMAFGSHRMVGGFILNNQLTDFSFLPAAEGRQVANRVEPGKRPRSSMTPTIVFDAEGKPAFALGSPGGASIIGYVTQAVIALIDWQRSPGAAAAAPHIVNRNGQTVLEAGTAIVGLKPELEALGHEVTERPMKSGLNIVQFKDGVMIGASDPRRDGIALAE